MESNLTWYVCRICLKTSHKLVSIFTNDDGKLLAEKISECGGIPIKLIENSNYPNKICSECLAYVNIAHKFRTTCMESHSILHFIVTEYLQKEYAESKSEVVIKSNNESENSENIEILENNSEGGSEFIEEKVITLVEQINSDDDKDNINQDEDKIMTESLDVSTTILPSKSKKNENRSILRSRSTSSPRVLFNQKSEINQIKVKSKEQAQQIISVDENGSVIIENKKDQLRKTQSQFVCEVCGNKYMTKALLQIHSRWHLRFKGYQCEICGKEFCRSFQLTRHLRIHTGVKPYTCSVCERKFSDYSTWTKHERTHTNERPYKCKICNKGFNYSEVAKKHMTVHTGEKPFSCELCGKTFSQKYHLKNHFATMAHKNKFTESLTSSNKTDAIDQNPDETATTLEN